MIHLKRFHVTVTQIVAVTLDESKFTPEFMNEFRQQITNFTTMQQHAEHLGQLYARGVAANGDFIEGYGPSDDMGIRFNDVMLDTDVDDAPSYESQVI